MQMTKSTIEHLEKKAHYLSVKYLCEMQPTF